MKIQQQQQQHNTASKWLGIGDLVGLMGVGWGAGLAGIGDLVGLPGFEALEL